MCLESDSGREACFPICVSFSTCDKRKTSTAALDNHSLSSLQSYLSGNIHNID